MAKASTKAAGKARPTGNYVAPASAKAKTAVIQRKPKAAAAKPKAAAKKSSCGIRFSFPQSADYCDVGSECVALRAALLLFQRRPFADKAARHMSKPSVRQIF